MLPQFGGGQLKSNVQYYGTGGHQWAWGVLYLGKITTLTAAATRFLVLDIM